LSQIQQWSHIECGNWSTLPHANTGDNGNTKAVGELYEPYATVGTQNIDSSILFVVEFLPILFGPPHLLFAIFQLYQMRYLFTDGRSLKSRLSLRGK
jgi:hypothetical protein